MKEILKGLGLVALSLEIWYASDCYQKRDIETRPDDSGATCYSFERGDDFWTRYEVCVENTVADFMIQRVSWSDCCYFGRVDLNTSAISDVEYSPMNFWNECKLDKIEIANDKQREIAKKEVLFALQNFRDQGKL
ncbi:hypothetical protein COV20_03640 [Candidatus Woesearchaeota archaeon CG10_big_fil_rev_8_21_14_0_10_45_16]|nr:MAG: hypothetical protein COV20_03640 [Candidatus Woesearchaeota archaeon CG10_big_fil_rev_8_21_14_0_10_45_16]